MNVSRFFSAILALSGGALLVSAAPAACAPANSMGDTTATPHPTATAVAVVDAGETDAADAAIPEPIPAPKAHRFAVASENATATNLAMDVLRRGGNAVDAAIAGLMGVGIAQPVSSGLGGGGFAVVWNAKTKSITVLDFRETAPGGTKASDFSKRPPKPEKRGVTVGTPGEVAGMFDMHARWGKMAMAEIVRGPAEAAEKGFPVSAHLARTLKWSEAWVLATPRYAFFTANGGLLPAGDLAKNAALSATLKRIGAEGKAAFYEGTIAADIVSTARAAGGTLTADELKSYKVLERTALKTSWGGYDVYTMPPPSAGGLMMLETLHMHTKADLTALGLGTPAYNHLLAETFRGAIADRARSIGDPDFSKVDVSALAAPERMKARRARIRMEETLPAEKFPLKESGTSHLIVVDDEGNVVSVTSTVNNPFGSRLVTSGGFVLNDQLDDFTTEEVEKRFGVKQGPNRPRPRARPTSSMTPTIVLKDGAPVLALGGSGGSRIATGTTQVLLAALAFDRPVTQAVADPRFDTPALGGLLLDANVPASDIEDLKKRGEVVDQSKPNFSAVQAMSIGAKDGVRVLVPAADPRKGGAASVE